MKTLSNYIETNPNIFIFPWQNETYQNEYNSNKDIINVVMKNKYGSLPMLLENDNETTSLIQGILLINKYKIDTLWDTTNLEYNPIWNVDGRTTTTNVYGEHETTNAKDKVETIAEYGDETKTEENALFPFNSETSTKSAENTLTNSKEDDKITINPTNETNTSKEHTDTITEERKGNIGVTSTQHLIMEERNVANFSFWNVLIEIVAKEITIPYYKELEYDCCYW